jgi:hypothetical protein
VEATNHKLISSLFKWIEAAVKKQPKYEAIIISFGWYFPPIASLNSHIDVAEDLYLENQIA